MTHAEFLSRVAERAGLADAEDAARTVRAVLEVVGERLGRRELQALAEDLPTPLGALLRDGTHGQDFDLAELYARVARREHVRPGFAVEHTGIVCQVLAEALSDGALHQLREALPEPLAALFMPRAHRERFEYVHLDPVHHHTLAEGQPGSQHPVSRARAERAHTHSVARSDEPHADTRLSSASGLTQERERETLATAHPGARLTQGEDDG
ncbi:DUF2267 domain-containing protein [Pyxidicoccus xibeiensis]|uniref:DUF2267 domain-containing protein n=1 Tax=Pyxidicoccus xibeiensis TaxID=2906759 RepID=UPI0020A8151F|nr:DUF2267 domain-containing protein [Pyxidicoccus xibeiensis]MCP3142293.1 DUF2267 domain-containing protein [Pyxidicoccus xibeiensis]